MVVFMDAVEESLETRVVNDHILCWLQLGIIAVATALTDSFLIVGWYEEWSTVAKITVEFSEEYSNAGKVEVAEVDIFVVDGL